MTDSGQVIIGSAPEPGAMRASASLYFALVLTISLPFYALGATGSRLAGL